MTLKDEINMAIMAHGAWKQKLRDFISGQNTELDPNKAGTDNSCNFGKWLYGDTISSHDKQSEFYQQIKEMHAEFHKTVKQVLELSLSGKKEDAEKLLTDGQSTYNKISSKLILKLAEWKKSE